MFNTRKLRPKSQHHFYKRKKTSTTVTFTSTLSTRVLNKWDAIDNLNHGS